MAPAALILLTSIASFMPISAAESYTAAVFEHARFGAQNDSARLVVETNLEYYRRATKVAKSKGADVIVFPEYGIFAPASRNELKEYLETIPDPKKSRVNPCNEPKIYSQRPILYTLSRLAKENSIVLVANMGDIQNCQEDPQCPEDGVFQFNTNVVFDRDGTLLVKYHKERLFFELAMDLAREQQNSTFKTDFGTFATYICFDIDYERMSEVARWPTVDGIMFSAVFLNKSPQMTTVQFWEAWALGNNATLMVSNIQMPGYLAMGSGIFHGEKGALSYTFNPDGFSKLVVSRVPKSDLSSVPLNASITAFSKDGTWEWEEDGKDIPLQCSRKLLNRTTDVYRDYRCMEENITFTLAKLEKDYGNVEACHSGFCCTLNYNTSGLNDQFYLGIFSGTYNHFNRYFWCEEDCVLARCDPLGSNPCATYPTRTTTTFQHVHLRANFTSEVVYPSVLGSGSRLVPRTEWNHLRLADEDASVHFHNEKGRKLLVVGMKGRCFEKDPPYQQ